MYIHVCQDKEHSQIYSNGDIKMFVTVEVGKVGYEVHDKSWQT